MHVTNHMIGGILLQVDNNNEEKPVAYIGRSLTENEKKYSATELEAIRLVCCKEKLHLIYIKLNLTLSGS